MPKRNRFAVLENPIDLNQRILNTILKGGDSVIDATCGNGHDSVFIAEKIGQAGHLFCFDTQAIAIKNTQEALQNLNNKPTCYFFNESHENLGNSVKSKVDCVFYNLGYLPNSDKSIITIAETTIKSLQSAFNLLKPNGIVSLISYLTHDEQNEFQQLKSFLFDLDYNKFSIAETTFILRKTSPVLFIIEML